MNVEEEVPVGHFKTVKRNPKRDIGTYIYRSTRSDSTIIIMDVTVCERHLQGKIKLELEG